MKAQFPEKLKPLFSPVRYKVAYGGRGGAKSWGFARALLIIAAEFKSKILCAREFQNSIKESVHALLCSQIEMLELSYAFKIQQTEITGYNGSEFIFSGIRTNPTRIKSMEGVDICWVEEAERVSNESWEILIPTIRAARSEIWISMNPHLETDPTYRRFIANPPPGAVLMPISWRDNPWFPDELKMEKDYLASVDPQAYAHVWEGGCQTRSDSQVLGGKYRIEWFEPQKDWDGPYFGADWGFSQDPTTLVKLWIHDRKLYVEREVWGIGIELDDIPIRFQVIPESKQHIVRGDCSRPETISYLQRHGYPNMRAAAKWPGSVEDGVAFLRSFESIIIHPDCHHTAEEARMYSYKVDRLTGDVLPDIVDASNHMIDGIRYALEPMIKNSGTGFLDLMRDEVETLRQQRAVV